MTSGLRAALTKNYSGWVVVLALLCLQCILHLILPARGITISDEGNYLTQADAFVHHRTEIVRINPLTGEAELGEPFKWQPGNSAVIAGLRLAAGPEAIWWLGPIYSAVFALSCASLLAGWNLWPGWAAIVFIYAPFDVLSRSLMSDIGAGAVCTCGLAIWNEGNRGDRRVLCFVGGFVLILATLFRDTTILIAAPFVIGSFFKKDFCRWATVSGLLAGVAVRCAIQFVVYGNLMLQHADGFTVTGVFDRLWFETLLLTVFLPGGLVAVFWYKGPSRAELTIGVVAIVTLHAFYTYDATSSGFLGRIVLVGRFLLPAVPLGILSIGRAMEGVRWSRVVAVTAAITLVILCSIQMSKLQVSAEAQTRLITSTTPTNALVYMNWWIAPKFPGAELDRRVAGVNSLTVADLRWVSQRNQVYLAVVDRRESEFWGKQTQEVKALLTDAEADPALQVYEVGHESPLFLFKVEPRAGRR